jgi:hypothetical protein
MGEVEGSEAYQGPDDFLLSPESLATPATVLTAQIRGKYRRSLPASRPQVYGTFHLQPGDIVALGSNIQTYSDGTIYSEA